MTLDELNELLQALEREQVAYVLIGGAALNVHGILRATEDIDIMVRPTEANIVALRAAFMSIWDDESINEISAVDLNGDYPVIRYGPPQGRLYVDILGRLGEAFSFDDIESQRVEVGGITATVATPAALFRMKRHTLRDIDRADAAMLQSRFKLNKE